MTTAKKAVLGVVAALLVGVGAGVWIAGSAAPELECEQPGGLGRAFEVNGECFTITEDAARELYYEQR